MAPAAAIIEEEHSRTVTSEVLKAFLHFLAAAVRSQDDGFAGEISNYYFFSLCSRVYVEPWQRRENIHTNILVQQAYELGCGAF